MQQENQMFGPLPPETPPAPPIPFPNNLHLLSLRPGHPGLQGGALRVDSEHSCLTVPLVPCGFSTPERIVMGKREASLIYRYAQGRCVLLEENKVTVK